MDAMKGTIATEKRERQVINEVGKSEESIRPQVMGKTYFKIKECESCLRDVDV